MQHTERTANIPTVELDRPLDLVDLGGRARDAGHDVALFERSATGATSVLGIGRRCEIVSCPGGAVLEDADGRPLDREEGSDRVAAAARLWRRFAGREAPPDGAGAPPGTGLVAIGGFAFDPGREPAGGWCGFPAVLFRVPALAVTTVHGRTYARGDLSLLDQPRTWSAAPAGRFWLEPVRPESQWIEAEAEATRRLRAGEANKVVLAREVVARADGVVHAGSVLRSLHRRYPGCFTYLVTGGDGSAFAGASPELLLRRMGRVASSQPMAGSIRRGADRAEDDALARTLRSCEKDRNEHRITARYVAGALAASSRDVRVGEPEIVRLANIQHLATTVLADLRDPPTPLAELGARLHPTPAVNGSPPASARRLIRELEGMERGWYGGAVGWMDARGDGELAVAIRCGLLLGDTARLYAGCGTMPDSEPEAELAETRLKLEALLGALRACGEGPQADAGARPGRMSAAPPLRFG
ncbi:MAG TPA: isochorismate synthase [Candidatus Dormibacteraeota bacterium]|jgi:isochorismate synthase